MKPFLITMLLLSSTLAAAAETRLVPGYGQLPLRFEANAGQADAPAKFLSRGMGYNLHLTSTEVVIAFPGHDTVLRLRLVGANQNAALTGIEKLPGTANYFSGRDPDCWRTSIPSYAKVKVESVYPGVDVEYYGNQHQLEYDLIVAPGTDPGVITLLMEGADRLEIDATATWWRRPADGRFIGANRAFTRK